MLNKEHALAASLLSASLVALVAAAGPMDLYHGLQVLTGGEGRGQSVAITSETIPMAAFGAAEQGANGEVDVWGRVGGDEYDYMARLTPSVNVAGVNQQFGHAVAMSGDIVMVGAPLTGAVAKQNAGSVYFYNRNSGGANQFGEIDNEIGPANGASGPNALLGHSVAISTNPGSGDDGWAVATELNSAQAIFFDGETASGSYTNVASVSIPAVGGAPRKAIEFGHDCDITFDGTVGRAVVGAPGDGLDDKSSGRVYVMHQNEGGADNWGVVQKLRNNVYAVGDGRNYRFGHSVAIHGNTLVVGEPDAKGADRTEENAANHATTGIGFPRVGALHVFTAAGDASTDLFNTVVHIRQPHMYANQRLGRSVAIFGDKIVSGSDSQLEAGRWYDLWRPIGALHVFHRNLGGPNFWGESQLSAEMKEGGPYKDHGFTESHLSPYYIGNSADEKSYGFGLSVDIDNRGRVIGGSLNEASIFTRRDFPCEYANEGAFSAGELNDGAEFYKLSWCRVCDSEDYAYSTRDECRPLRTNPVLYATSLFISFAVWLSFAFACFGKDILQDRSRQKAAREYAARVARKKKKAAAAAKAAGRHDDEDDFND